MATIRIKPTGYSIGTNKPAETVDTLLLHSRNLSPLMPRETGALHTSFGIVIFIRFPADAGNLKRLLDQFETSPRDISIPHPKVLFLFFHGVFGEYYSDARHCG